MNKNEDTWYIKAVLEGNTSAFASLVDKYKDMVFTIAFRITGNREDAEEVAQDTFLNAYRGLSGFKKQSGFATWLYRIAYNQAISKIRKKKIDTEPIEKKQYLYETYGEEDAAFFEKHDEVPVHCIEKALNSLDETGYALMNFYYRESLPVKEISGITGLSVSNVKVKLFRSRKIFLEKLKTVLNARVNDLI
jgi:RNA polymerase sigma factor (sigma-70 family)